MKKPILIARKEDVDHFESLGTKPKVRRYWEVPYGYVFIDFWDDAYIDIYNKDKKYHSDPVLKEKAAQLRKEEESLIAPMFKRATETNFVAGMIFCLNGEAYDLKLLRKERFVETQYFKADTISIHCRIEAVFKKLTVQHKSVFENVICDWQKWDSCTNQKIVTVSKIDYHDGQGVLDIDFEQQFEDTLAAFIVMQNAKRLDTTISKLIY